MLLDFALTELLLTKDYTPQSRQRREYALRQFIEWAGAQGVTTVEGISSGAVRRYLAHLREQPNLRWGDHLAAETQHSRASIVRMFLRFCAREGWLDDRVVSHIEMPKRPQKVIQVFTKEHHSLLLQACDACYVRWIRIRDRALLTLLFETGARASELCSLRLDMVFLIPGQSYIRVYGKGRREREIGLGRQAALAIHRYLSRARPNASHEYVFLGRDRRPMTANTVDKVLYRLLAIAGEEHFRGIRVSAHSYRHSFAVHYMQQGGDVYKLSRLLGHERLETTERYLRAFRARDARLTSKSVLDNL